MGGVAPAPKVGADGAVGDLDAEALADQVADGAARPQGVRQAQVFGTVSIDLGADLLGLFVGKQSAGAERPAGAPSRQGLEPLGLISGPPPANGFGAHAQQVGEFDFQVAEFDPAQGAKAEQLQGLIGQLTGVWQLDRHGSPPLQGDAVDTSIVSDEQLSCRGNKG